MLSNIGFLSFDQGSGFTRSSRGEWGVERGLRGAARCGARGAGCPWRRSRPSRSAGHRARCSARGYPQTRFQRPVLFCLCFKHGRGRCEDRAGVLRPGCALPSATWPRCPLASGFGRWSVTAGLVAAAPRSPFQQQSAPCAAGAVLSFSTSFSGRVGAFFCGELPRGPGGALLGSRGRFPAFGRLVVLLKTEAGSSRSAGVVGGSVPRVP